MSTSHSGTSLAQSFINFRFTFFNLIRNEKHFLLLIATLFFIAGTAYPYPGIAMWIGFMLAGYSVIANDSIHAVGTFISSNRGKPWWVLWVFIGLLAGRELAMRSFQKNEHKPLRSTFRLIGKDLLFALIALAVSIALAAATNPAIFAGVFNR